MRRPIFKYSQPDPEVYPAGPSGSRMTAEIGERAEALDRIALGNLPDPSAGTDVPLSARWAGQHRDLYQQQARNRRRAEEEAAAERALYQPLLDVEDVMGSSGTPRLSRKQVDAANRALRGQGLDLDLGYATTGRGTPDTISRLPSIGLDTGALASGYGRIGGEDDAASWGSRYADDLSAARRREADGSRDAQYLAAGLLGGALGIPAGSLAAAGGKTTLGKLGRFAAGAAVPALLAGGLASRTRRRHQDAVSEIESSRGADALSASQVAAALASRSGAMQEASTPDAGLRVERLQDLPDPASVTGSRRIIFGQDSRLHAVDPFGLDKRSSAPPVHAYSAYHGAGMNPSTRRHAFAKISDVMESPFRRSLQEEKDLTQRILDAPSRPWEDLDPDQFDNYDEYLDEIRDAQRSDRRMREGMMRHEENLNALDRVERQYGGPEYGHTDPATRGISLAALRAATNAATAAKEDHRIAYFGSGDMLPNRKLPVGIRPSELPYGLGRIGSDEEADAWADRTADNRLNTALRSADLMRGSDRAGGVTLGATLGILGGAVGASLGDGISRRGGVVGGALGALPGLLLGAGIYRGAGKRHASAVAEARDRDAQSRPLLRQTARQLRPLSGAEDLARTPGNALRVENLGGSLPSPRAMTEGRRVLFGDTGVHTVDSTPLLY